MTIPQQFQLYDGTTIPSIGLGTWQAKPGEVGAAVKFALAAGYRHIDCAHIYQNEKEVGVAIKEAGVPRDQLFITSKLWNSDHDPQRVRPACELTLKNLGLQYLDLYLIHWPLHFAVEDFSKIFDDEGKLRLKQTCTLLDTWRAMEQLVDAGLCKHIGVSNFTREHLDQILPHCRIKPAMNQVELHPYLPQNELVEYCRSQGILCTAYSPLGSAKEPSLIKDPVVERIAKQHNVSPAQILISWAVQRGTVCIPKSVHAERIRQNSQLVKLTGAEMNELSSDIKTRHRFCSPALFWGQPLFEDEKQQ